MITFELIDNNLWTINTRQRISLEIFKELTGSTINFSIRNNKQICVWRNKGHLYISDLEFLVDEIYMEISTKKRYICTTVNKDGKAILSSMDNTLEFKCSDNPLNFYIAPEFKGKK